ncbi:UNVERIFIED_CONTAM: hypothetical protein HHA_242750 [Hammondia hammondi]|eukprot:XP_008884402.1 hypothetical protein HHA_242750 [Hammondia hammondi]
MDDNCRTVNRCCSECNRAFGESADDSDSCSCTVCHVHGPEGEERHARSCRSIDRSRPCSCCTDAQSRSASSDGRSSAELVEHQSLGLARSVAEAVASAFSRPSLTLLGSPTLSVFSPPESCTGAEKRTLLRMHQQALLALSNPSDAISAGLHASTLPPRRKKTRRHSSRESSRGCRSRSTSSKRLCHGAHRGKHHRESRGRENGGRVRGGLTTCESPHPTPESATRGRRFSPVETSFSCIEGSCSFATTSAGPPNSDRLSVDSLAKTWLSCAGCGHRRSEVDTSCVSRHENPTCSPRCNGSRDRVRKRDKRGRGTQTAFLVGSKRQVNSEARHTSSRPACLSGSGRFRDPRNESPVSRPQSEECSEVDRVPRDTAIDGEFATPCETPPTPLSAGHSFSDLCKAKRVSPAVAQLGQSEGVREPQQNLEHCPVHGSKLLTQCRESTSARESDAASRTGRSTTRQQQTAVSNLERPISRHTEHEEGCPLYQASCASPEQHQREGKPSNAGDNVNSSCPVHFRGTASSTAPREASTPDHMEAAYHDSIPARCGAKDTERDAEETLKEGASRGKSRAALREHRHGQSTKALDASSETATVGGEKEQPHLIMASACSSDFSRPLLNGSPTCVRSSSHCPRDRRNRRRGENQEDSISPRHNSRIIVARSLAASPCPAPTAGRSPASAAVHVHSVARTRRCRTAAEDEFREEIIGKVSLSSCNAENFLAILKEQENYVLALQHQNEQLQDDLADAEEIPEAVIQTRPREEQTGTQKLKNEFAAPVKQQADEKRQTEAARQMLAEAEVARAVAEQHLHATETAQRELHEKWEQAEKTLEGLLEQVREMEVTEKALRRELTEARTQKAAAEHRLEEMTRTPRAAAEGRHEDKEMQTFPEESVDHEKVGMALKELEVVRERESKVKSQLGELQKKIAKLEEMLATAVREKEDALKVVEEHRTLLEHEKRQCESLKEQLAKQAIQLTKSEQQTKRVSQRAEDQGALREFVHQTQAQQKQTRAKYRMRQEQLETALMAREEVLQRQIECVLSLRVSETSPEPGEVFDRPASAERHRYRCEALLHRLCSLDVKVERQKEVTSQSEMLLTERRLSRQQSSERHQLQQEELREMLLAEQLARIQARDERQQLEEEIADLKQQQLDVRCELEKLRSEQKSDNLRRIEACHTANFRSFQAERKTTERDLGHFSHEKATVAERSSMNAFHVRSVRFGLNETFKRQRSSEVTDARAQVEAVEVALRALNTELRQAEEVPHVHLPSSGVTREVEHSQPTLCKSEMQDRKADLLVAKVLGSQISAAAERLGAAQCRERSLLAQIAEMEKNAEVATVQSAVATPSAAFQSCAEARQMLQEDLEATLLHLERNLALLEAERAHAVRETAVVGEQQALLEAQQQTLTRLGEALRSKTAAEETAKREVLDLVRRIQELEICEQQETERLSDCTTALDEALRQLHGAQLAEQELCATQRRLLEMENEGKCREEAERKRTQERTEIELREGARTVAAVLVTKVGEAAAAAAMVQEMQRLVWAKEKEVSDLAAELERKREELKAEKAKHAQLGELARENPDASRGFEALHRASQNDLKRLLENPACPANCESDCLQMSFKQGLQRREQERQRQGASSPDEPVCDIKEQEASTTAQREKRQMEKQVAAAVHALRQEACERRTMRVEELDGAIRELVRQRQEADLLASHQHCEAKRLAREREDQVESLEEERRRRIEQIEEQRRQREESVHALALQRMRWLESRERWQLQHEADKAREAELSGQLAFASTAHAEVVKKLALCKMESARALAENGEKISQLQEEHEAQQALIAQQRAERQELVDRHQSREAALLQQIHLTTVELGSMRLKCEAAEKNLFLQETREHTALAVEVARSCLEHAKSQGLLKKLTATELEKEELTRAKEKLQVQLNQLEEACGEERRWFQSLQKEQEEAHASQIEALLAAQQLQRQLHAEETGRALVRGLELNGALHQLEKADRDADRLLADRLQLQREKETLEGQLTSFQNSQQKCLEEQTRLDKQEMAGTACRELAAATAGRWLQAVEARYAFARFEEVQEECHDSAKKRHELAEELQRAKEAERMRWEMQHRLLEEERRQHEAAVQRLRSDLLAGQRRLEEKLEQERSAHCMEQQILQQSSELLLLRLDSTERRLRNQEEEARRLADEKRAEGETFRREVAQLTDGLQRAEAVHAELRKEFEKERFELESEIARRRHQAEEGLLRLKELEALGRERVERHEQELTLAREQERSLLAEAFEAQLREQEDAYRRHLELELQRQREEAERCFSREKKALMEAQEEALAERETQIESQREAQEREFQSQVETQKAAFEQKLVGSQANHARLLEEQLKKQREVLEARQRKDIEMQLEQQRALLSHQRHALEAELEAELSQNRAALQAQKDAFEAEMQAQKTQLAEQLEGLKKRQEDLRQQRERELAEQETALEKKKEREIAEQLEKHRVAWQAEIKAALEALRMHLQEEFRRQHEHDLAGRLSATETTHQEALSRQRREFEMEMEAKLAAAEQAREAQKKQLQNEANTILLERQLSYEGHLRVQQKQLAEEHERALAAQRSELLEAETRRFMTLRKELGKAHALELQVQKNDVSGSLALHTQEEMRFPDLQGDQMALYEIDAINQSHEAPKEELGKLRNSVEEERQETERHFVPTLAGPPADELPKRGEEDSVAVANEVQKKGDSEAAIRHAAEQETGGKEEETWREHDHAFQTEDRRKGLVKDFGEDVMKDVREDVKSQVNVTNEREVEVVQESLQGSEERLNEELDEQAKQHFMCQGEALEASEDSSERHDNREKEEKPEAQECEAETTVAKAEPAEAKLKEERLEEKKDEEVNLEEISLEEEKLVEAKLAKTREELQRHLDAKLVMKEMELRAELQEELERHRLRFAAKSREQEREAENRIQRLRDSHRASAEKARSRQLQLEHQLQELLDRESVLRSELERYHRSEEERLNGCLTEQLAQPELMHTEKSLSEEQENFEWREEAQALHQKLTDALEREKHLREAADAGAVRMHKTEDALRLCEEELKDARLHLKDEQDALRLCHEELEAAQLQLIDSRRQEEETRKAFASMVAEAETLREQLGKAQWEAERAEQQIQDMQLRHRQEQQQASLERDPREHESLGDEMGRNEWEAEKKELTQRLQIAEYELERLQGNLESTREAGRAVETEVEELRKDLAAAREEKQPLMDLLTEVQGNHTLETLQDSIRIQQLHSLDETQRKSEFLSLARLEEHPGNETSEENSGLERLVKDEEKGGQVLSAATESPASAEKETQELQRKLERGEEEKQGSEMRETESEDNFVAQAVSVTQHRQALTEANRERKTRMPALEVTSGVVACHEADRAEREAEKSETAAVEAEKAAEKGSEKLESAKKTRDERQQSLDLAQKVEELKREIDAKSALLHKYQGLLKLKEGVTSWQRLSTREPRTISRGTSSLGFEDADSEAQRRELEALARTKTELSSQKTALKIEAERLRQEAAKLRRDQETHAEAREKLQEEARQIHEEAKQLDEGRARLRVAQQQLERKEEALEETRVELAGRAEALKREEQTSERGKESVLHPSLAASKAKDLVRNRRSRGDGETSIPAPQRAQGALKEEEESAKKCEIAQMQHPSNQSAFVLRNGLTVAEGRRHLLVQRKETRDANQGNRTVGLLDYDPVRVEMRTLQELVHQKDVEIQSLAETLLLHEAAKNSGSVPSKRFPSQTLQDLTLRSAFFEPAHTSAAARPPTRRGNGSVVFFEESEKRGQPKVPSPLEVKNLERRRSEETVQTKSFAAQALRAVSRAHGVCAMEAVSESRASNHETIAKTVLHREGEMMEPRLEFGQPQDGRDPRGRARQRHPEAQNAWPSAAPQLGGDFSVTREALKTQERLGSAMKETGKEGTALARHLGYTLCLDQVRKGLRRHTRFHGLMTSRNGLP